MLYNLKCCMKMLTYDAGYLFYGLVYYNLMNMDLILRDMTSVPDFPWIQIFFGAMYISFVIVSRYLTGAMFDMFEKGE